MSTKTPIMLFLSSIHLIILFKSFISAKDVDLFDLNPCWLSLNDTYSLENVYYLTLNKSSNNYVYELSVKNNT